MAEGRHGRLRIAADTLPANIRQPSPHTVTSTPSSRASALDQPALTPSSRSDPSTPAVCSVSTAPSHPPPPRLSSPPSEGCPAWGRAESYPLNLIRVMPARGTELVVDFLSDPKMRTYFSQLLGASEEVLWFQENRFGSRQYKYFAFLSLGVSAFWAIIVLGSLLIGLSFGTPVSHPWWAWLWSVIAYFAAIFIPFLGSLSLLKVIKKTVHVLTQKRLILANTRWPGSSLKIYPIDGLRLERRHDGESNVLVELSHHSKRMLPLEQFIDRTILSNIKNPDLFASVLGKHGRQAHPSSGAIQ